MKMQLLFTIFIALMLVACNNHPIENQQQAQTPKALKDNLSSEINIKSRRNDLTESLYSELVEQTPELKELENNIKNLAESKYDSTAAFINYNDKNQLYYNSANNHLSQIGDSVLRDKIKSLIAVSLEKYSANIVQDTALLKSIDNKILTLDDLHAVLKITRTLPLIERYQHNNLPSTKSMDGYTKQLDEALKYADSLTKR